MEYSEWLLRNKGAIGEIQENLFHASDFIVEIEVIKPIKHALRLIPVGKEE